LLSKNDSRIEVLSKEELLQAERNISIKSLRIKEHGKGKAGSMNPGRARVSHFE